MTGYESSPNYVKVRSDRLGGLGLTSKGLEREESR